MVLTRTRGRAPRDRIASWVARRKTTLPSQGCFLLQLLIFRGRITTCHEKRRRKCRLQDTLRSGQFEFIAERFFPRPRFSWCRHGLSPRSHFITNMTGRKCLRIVSSVRFKTREECFAPYLRQGMAEEPQVVRSTLLLPSLCPARRGVRHLLMVICSEWS